MSRHYRATLC